MEIIFNVLKAPVLAEIEKSPKTGDFSHLLREDSAYKSKLVDRKKDNTKQYSFIDPFFLHLLVSAKKLMEIREVRRK